MSTCVWGGGGWEWSEVGVPCSSSSSSSPSSHAAANQERQQGDDSGVKEEGEEKEQQEKEKEIMAFCNMRRRWPQNVFVPLTRREHNVQAAFALMMHWSKKEQQPFRRQICKLKQSQVDKLTFSGH